MNLDRLTCAFLNLPDTNDHKRLLGVPKGRFDAIAVESALRRRLAQILVHPAGRSNQATDVRSFLQRIASDLMKSVPKKIEKQAASQPELTALDQAIIAVLIGDGGWNRQSRSRLVGVAATYNITVGGLMRILEALAESSRSGDGPLSAGRRSTITMERSWTQMPAKLSAVNKVEEFIDQTTKKFTPELRAPTRVMTIKLSILFAILTLIALILSLSVLLSSDDEIPAVENFESTDRNSSLNTPSEEVVTPKISSIFDEYPTFPVQVLGNEAIHEADNVLSVVKDLSALSTSIRDSLLRGENTSTEWIKTWKRCIKSTSIGWLHVDSSTLRSVSDRMCEVLSAAELQQTYVDELLQQLHIPNLQLRSPLTVHQRVWTAGILAKISCDPKLNSVTRTSARSHQLPRLNTCDEVEARHQILDFVARELIDLTEFDDRVFVLWESWLTCSKQLQPVVSSVTRQLIAMQNLLETNVDLSRISNTRKVLGRIVQEIEWTKGETSRDFVLALYRNDSISSKDLHALGFLFHSLKNNTWFLNKHHISSNATSRERKAIASVLTRDWPLTAVATTPSLHLKIPPGFDASFPIEWKSRLKRIQSAPGNSPSTLASLRLLNQSSVSLWRGRPDLAFDLLEKVDTLDLLVPEKVESKILPNDGSWSSSYFDARSDKEARIDAIDTLYNSAATDLGPLDAETLAAAALLQQSIKIRKAATEAVIHQFSRGTNVAIAILNNLHRARSKQQIAKLVANLTEAILPEFSDSRWDHEARRALVQHALTVKYPEQKELDAVSNALSRSLMSETILIDPSILPPSREVDALAAIKMLVRAWKRDLTTMYASTGGIVFSPTGVMQEYLQYQLQYLQLLAAEEARWRGLEEIDDSTRLITKASANATNIVQQVTRVEMEIAHHWDRLLSDLSTEYMKTMKQ